MKTVIIDRQKWYRGRGAVNSRLLVPDENKMCCLGFVCLAFGHTEDEIYDSQAGPKDRVAEGLEGLFEETYDQNGVFGFTDIGIIIAEVNDSGHIDDSLREEKLKKIFAEQNIKLEFIN